MIRRPRDGHVRGRSDGTERVTQRRPGRLRQHRIGAADEAELEHRVLAHLLGPGAEPGLGDPLPALGEAVAAGILAEPCPARGGRGGHLAEDTRRHTRAAIAWTNAAAAFWKGTFPDVRHGPGQPCSA